MSEIKKSLEVMASVLECYAVTYCAINRKRGIMLSQEEATAQSQAIMDRVFKKIGFNPSRASRKLFEVAIEKLNEEFGVMDDPELLTEHNATLFIHISGLQPHITIM